MMKATVHEESQSRRALEVEVPAEEVQREIDLMAREYARNVKIPGFRPGHIPKEIVRKRFGKEIEGEVIEKLAKDYSWKVIEEKELQPLGAPVVEKFDYQAGGPLTFRTTFDVRPAFTLGQYKGLEAVGKKPAVPPELVDKNLESLREQNARLEAVEGRPLAEADYAVVDLQPLDAKGTARGKLREGITLLLADDGAPADLRQQLVGMEVGASRDVVVSHAAPEPAPGTSPDTSEPAQPAVVLDEPAAPAPKLPPPDRYRVTLRSIRRRVLPPLDNDLAKDVGPFETLEDLKKRVREDLERRAAGQAEDQVRESLMKQLVDAHSFPPPEVMVEQELNYMVERVLSQVMQAGADPRRVGIDWEERRREMRPAAEGRVRAELILDEIARAEGIEVTDDDVLAALVEQAQRDSTTPEALRDALKRDGRLNLLKQKMLREKSLDLVVRSANIIG